MNHFLLPGLGTAAVYKLLKEISCLFLGKATSFIWLRHQRWLLEVLLQYSGVTWEERLSGVWSGIQVVSVFADWDKHSSSRREFQPISIPSFSSSYRFSGKMSYIYLGQLSTLIRVEPVSSSTFASTLHSVIHLTANHIKTELFCLMQSANWQRDHNISRRLLMAPILRGLTCCCCGSCGGVWADVSPASSQQGVCFWSRWTLVLFFWRFRLAADKSPCFCPGSLLGGGLQLWLGWGCDGVRVDGGPA